VCFAVLISIIVTALERITVAAKTTRHTSQGEIKYLQRLGEKYGNDVEQMARDRKLNTDQRTAGELRRALRRAGVLAAGKGTGKGPVYGEMPNAAQ
jgi:nucleolar protein 16